MATSSNKEIKIPVKEIMRASKLVIEVMVGGMAGFRWRVLIAKGLFWLISKVLPFQVSVEFKTKSNGGPKCHEEN